MRDATKKADEDAKAKEDGAMEDDGYGGKRLKAGSAAAGGASAAAATERTLFHGDAVLDYQGRSYMHPASDVRPEDHACHIPESLVHTWAGHTKGRFQWSC